MEHNLTDPEPIPENLGQPVRSLASLTDDEAKTLFKLSFNRHPDPLFWTIDDYSNSTVRSRHLVLGDNGHSLTIWTDGHLLATENEGMAWEGARFNAYKVLIYLALLGIQLDRSAGAKA